MRQSYHCFSSLITHPWSLSSCHCTVKSHTLFKLLSHSRYYLLRNRSWCDHSQVTCSVVEITENTEIRHSVYFLNTVTLQCLWRVCIGSSGGVLVRFVNLHLWIHSMWEHASLENQLMQGWVVGFLPSCLVYVNPVCLLNFSCWRLFRHSCTRRLRNRITVREIFFKCRNLKILSPLNIRNQSLFNSFCKYCLVLAIKTVFLMIGAQSPSFLTLVQDPL